MSENGKKWEYSGYYKGYDMALDEIAAGTGIVKVHDIFNPLPAFMKKATVLFSDPPCGQGNIKSFYTKADIGAVPVFDSFRERFFQCMDEIAPHTVFIEVFKQNKSYFFDQIAARFADVQIVDSTYYHSRKHVCWIVCATNAPSQFFSNVCASISGIDEQDAISKICQLLPQDDTIGDLCMGQGFVGFYANHFGKRFVGTELNKKRLGVLLHRIETGSLK